MASWGRGVCLGWTGTDYRLNLMWSADGVHFGDKRTLQHRSFRIHDSSDEARTQGMPPTLVATGEGLLMGWTGPDRTGPDRRPKVLNLNRGEAGPTTLSQLSKVAPALAQAGSQVALAWAGQYGQLNVAYGAPGGFGAPFLLGQKTSRAPALCPWGDDVIVAWTGTDRRLNLAVVRSGVAEKPTRFGATSWHGPALCPWGDDVIVAWTGTDRRLNVMAATPRGRLGPVTTLSAKSPTGPAVAVHENQPLVAWMGGDRRLNVARLQPF